MAHVFRMLHRVSQFLATLPRAGQQPGTSENSVTFAAPKYVPDRGMMTHNGPGLHAACGAASPAARGASAARPLEG